MFESALAEYSDRNNGEARSGKRLLGFPAGPQGLMHRFFEGLDVDLLRVIMR